MTDLPKVTDEMFERLRSAAATSTISAFLKPRQSTGDFWDAIEAIVAELRRLRINEPHDLSTIGTMILEIEGKASAAIKRGRGGVLLGIQKSYDIASVLREAHLLRKGKAQALRDAAKKCKNCGGTGSVSCSVPGMEPLDECACCSWIQDIAAEIEGGEDD